VKRKVALLVAGVLSLVLCAAGGPKIELSWKNPNYAGGTFKNIMVLALNGQAANRAEFEDELVAAISRPGVMVAPSYEFIARPDSTPIDPKDLREIVRSQNFDAIVVARLTKNQEKTTYVPGEVYTPFPYYGTFYGYYAFAAPLVYDPGYMKTEKEAQVEVNVYSTAKPEGELAWTGTTNTFDAQSAMKVIKDLVKIVTEEIEKEDLIPASQ
jgi:hypothetical protein